MSKKQRFATAQAPQTAEPVYLMEAANGMLVRVPQSRLEAWQEEQKAANPENGLQQHREYIKSRILQDLYHT